MTAPSFEAQLIRLVLKRLPPVQVGVLLALPVDGDYAPVHGFRPQVSASCMRAVRVGPTGVTVPLVEREYLRIDQMPRLANGLLDRDAPERFRLLPMGQKVAAAIRARATA